MTTPNIRERLSWLMDERRQELRLTWDVVAQSAGLSREGLRRVREGDRGMRTLTKRGIEDALNWEPGSVDAILAGGEPTPALGARFTPTPLGDLIERARRRTDLKSWAEAEEAAIVDDWIELLQVQEPEGREAAALARMSHVVGLAPSEVEGIGYLDVARRMRKLREGEGTAKVVRPRATYREEPEFEEGSIRNRVEELIRRRKLRQLDRALSLIEDLDEDAG